MSIYAADAVDARHSPITPEVVAAFAEASGDDNPMHTDPVCPQLLQVAGRAPTSIISEWGSLPQRDPHGVDTGPLDRLPLRVPLPVELGGTGVLQDAWDPSRFVELVEEHCITYTSGATSFLYDLLAAPNLAERDVSSLVRFCCMGAPIPRAYPLGKAGLWWLA